MSKGRVFALMWLNLAIFLLLLLLLRKKPNLRSRQNCCSNNNLLFHCIDDTLQSRYVPSSPRSEYPKNVFKNSWGPACCTWRCGSPPFSLTFNRQRLVSTIETIFKNCTKKNSRNQRRTVRPPFRVVSNWLNLVCSLELVQPSSCAAQSEQRIGWVEVLFSFCIITHSHRRTFWLVEKLSACC